MLLILLAVNLLLKICVAKGVFGVALRAPFVAAKCPPRRKIAAFACRKGRFCCRFACACAVPFVILSVAKNPHFHFVDTSLTLSMTSKPCFCGSALACLCGSAGFFARSAKSLFGLRLCARLGLAFLPCSARWLAFWANLAFWLAYSLSF